MKHLVLSVAGLGWKELERRGAMRLAGLEFRAAVSVYPAVTCVAQATLRTGLDPREHGMTSNGWWCHATRRPSFWEQSSNLVLGPRVWDAARAAGATVGMFFFQQSIGEDVDVLVSPAHVHKHGGGSILYRYTVPPEADEALRRACGAFPLWRYWGPLAHPKAGGRVAGAMPYSPRTARSAPDFSAKAARHSSSRRKKPNARSQRGSSGPKRCAS